MSNMFACALSKPMKVCINKYVCANIVIDQVQCTPAYCFSARVSKVQIEALNHIVGTYVYSREQRFLFMGLSQNKKSTIIVESTGTTLGKG